MQLAFQSGLTLIEGEMRVSQDGAVFFDDWPRTVTWRMLCPLHLISTVFSTDFVDSL